ncbi:MAG: formylglycine-generating enzyme family protein, partial [Nitrospinaceae bacterium]
LKTLFSSLRGAFMFWQRVMHAGHGWSGRRGKMKPGRAVLVVSLIGALVLPGVPVRADEAPAAPGGVLEKLEDLKDKVAWETAQLKRLAAMASIPAGPFRMGDAAGQGENPAHQVILDAFYMDVFEVTQLQYLSLTGENPSYFEGCPLCPVEKVTFYDAETYCRQAGKRLPTEAEWEKAARGGAAGSYHWERDIMDKYAWYGNNSGSQPRPVGTREPNGYGIYDVSGNVWEWVADWYDPGYYLQSPERNPQGPDTGDTKAVRGGGWGNPPEFLTLTYRDSREPTTRYINVGFRCAKDAPRRQ